MVTSGLNPETIDKYRLSYRADDIHTIPIKVSYHSTSTVNQLEIKLTFTTYSSTIVHYTPWLTDNTFLYVPW